MSVILVRYSEIGLKSKPIRKRFETQLRDNMMSMLAYDGVETLIRSDESRIYVECSDPPLACRSLRRVFGVASMSIAEVCGSDMEEICERVSEYSLSRLSKDQSFAVRARREGSHRYTSMELGKEAGSAIFIANEDKSVTVDLTRPDVIFYIEVRNNKAFIFDTYIHAYAGLPLGSQGRVVAEVNNERDLLSAWLMMKRGCRAIVYGNGDVSLLKKYDTNLKIVPSTEVRYVKDVLGIVMGLSVHEIKDIDVSKYSLPVYFPTVGMDDEEVNDALYAIKTECQYF